MSRVTAGSLELEVEVSGKGEPLLLIMGLGMDKRGWLLQIPFFANSFKTIAFDNRGVGKSDVPPGPYTTAEMADDAASLLQALDIPRAHVVGISMGGMIAQQLALRHPELVEKLVLVCTYCAVDEAVARVSRQLTEKILGAGKSWEDADPSALSLEKILYAMMDVVFTPQFLTQNRPLIEGFYQEILNEKPSLEGFFYQLAATQAHNTCDQLSAIRQPTLILHGREDALIPCSAAQVLHEKIPGSELTLLEGTGHGLNFEKPQEFNSLVAGFLNRP